jgi:hypothetical protein
MVAMADKYERFIAAYLRLNAYFTITNFIVHTPERRRNGHIGNYTETDILGIRMPYSVERAGPLQIANDPPLTAGGSGKIDVVIGEVKSGRDSTPNTIWNKGVSSHAIEYIVRFVGLHGEREIDDVGNIPASHESNKHYMSKRGDLYQISRCY